MSHNNLFSKRRTGKECKKTNCKYHESYKRWRCGDRNLNFCMKCKNAHVSQYSAKKKEAQNEQ